MKRCAAVLVVMLVLTLVLPAIAQAEVVGRITQVEGKVDLLKAGKLPATLAKLDGPIELGDVIRTKSLSRTQLTFMDNTVLTISPESRLAIEEYMFDPAKGKRSAVLQLFQGLAHVVVTKLFKVQEPDFLIKTHTAVMGVRGTEVGIRLAPNTSTFLNFQGITSVANIFAEVGDLMFKRAQKIAFSFGRASVTLHDMQGSMVARGLPPTLPFEVSREDQKQFMQQLSSGLTTSKQGKDSGTGTAAQASSSGGTGGSGTGGTSSTAGGGTADAGASAAAAVLASTPVTGTSLTTLASDMPLSSTTPTGTASNLAVDNQVLNSGIGTVSTSPSQASVIVTIPPNPGTNTDSGTSGGGTSGGESGGGGTGGGGETPSPATYTFASIANGAFQTTGGSGGTSNTVNSTGWGIRTISGSSDPVYYTYTSSGSNTLTAGTPFATTSTGTSQSIITGTLTGVSGGNLTGPVTITSTDSYGQTFTTTTTATLEPSGRLYYSYTAALTGSLRTATISRDVSSVPGTYFTQTLDGLGLLTSSAPYTTQTISSTWAGGSRTGVLPGYYSATLTGTETSQWAYTYLPQGYGGFDATMAGVVSPGPGGTLVGALTISPSDQDIPRVSNLTLAPGPYLFFRNEDLNTPIVSSFTIQPDGTASGTAYSTDYRDGRFGSSVYTLTQTPVTSPVTGTSADYPFSQTFNGVMYLNTGSSSNTLLTFANGWGQRTGVYAGYFAAFTDNNSTWTLTSGSLPTFAGQSSYSSPIAVTRMDGTVSGVLGKTLNGTMYFFGSLVGGTSFSYSGPVKMENDGYLTFNYTGGWLSSSGSGTASGSLNQYSGYHFTQSLSGNYTLTSDGTNGTFAVSGGSGSRTEVDPGSLGSFNANFNLYSPTGALPASSSGPVTISAEGVVGNSELGAKFGNATYTLGSPFNYSIPGFIGITPNGGSYFNSGGLFINSSTGIREATIVTPSILYAFTQTYYGFRLGVSSSPFSLSSIEGYAWGQRIGVAGDGAVALPASYSPNGGYFIAQNLATAAAAPGVLTPNWVSIFGGIQDVTNVAMSARVTGAIGSTLSGNATFTAYSSVGTTYSYQGTVALSPDGKLTFMYGGTATTATGQPITQSGVMQQVPGTYFTETASGNLQQTGTTTSTPGGQLSVASLKDTSTLSGSRTIGETTTPTTASFAGLVSSTVNTFPAGPNTQSATLNIEGVVAGNSWETKWGVATGTVAGLTVNGVVTLDTNGKGTGQFVDQIPNPSGAADKVSINAVSVPTGTGQTTSSFAQTLLGTFTSTAANNGTQSVITAPSLTGTSTGTLSGSVNGSYITSNTTAVPGSLATNAGNTTAFVVGVVGGPTGGVQTGTASTQMVNTVTPTAGIPLQPRFEGTAVLTPAAGSSPASLTTTLNGALNLVPPNATRVQTIGALVTTRP